MRERPILFSGPMVQALLASRKTVTRRLAKERHFSPEFHTRCPAVGVAQALREFSPPCPYGQPGDRLWVKETWRPVASSMGHRIGWKLTYAADGAVLFSDLSRVDASWRRPKAAERGNVSPLLMPRWASRLTLEVTAVRVDRLHDITEEDAKAEGVGPAPFCKAGRPAAHLHIESFEDLWTDINGRASWDVNPWVWRIQFKRVEAST